MVFKVETLVLVLGLSWLIILTSFFLKLYFYQIKLRKHGEKESLIGILERILDKEEDLEKTIAHINARCDTLEKNDSFHIQKVGLLRFNPFKDTGGDQSFILALLDAKDTGVVVSSLHTRTGTRWYAKKVAKGHGVEYVLSDDEKKTLKEATFLETKSVEDKV